MNAIIDAAMNRARTVVLVLLLILVAGAQAYITIPKESDPDVQIPVIYVSLHLEGISPEDSERLLLRPLETHLSSIEGIKEMRGNAYESGGSIYMEFDAGFDSDRALQDVRDKVDEARPELPDEVDEPAVHEINLSLFPVVSVILQGTVDERTMLRLARDLRDKIESIPTVLEAKISGDREEALEIIIDPMVLESYGLTPAETFAIFQNNNVLVTAGALDTGEGSFSVKVPGLFEEVNDFLNLPVKVEEEAIVRLRDVAQVRRWFKDPTGYARANGYSSIALDVSKRSGENIIDTVEAVRQLVDQEKQFWPAGVSVIFASDNSDNIREMLSSLQNNIIFAVFLVIVVLMAFMGYRAAGLVALTIPGAFLIGILFLSFMGTTLNIVVLFSLILSIGMLVDAGIVVCEFAERKLSEGVSPRKAYAMGAKRMAWPVIASTITTLVVFMPLLFWPGIVGQFMQYLPMTLIVTLAGSLLMALVFLPTIGAALGSWWARRQGTVPDDEDDNDSDRWDGRLESLHPFTRTYAHALGTALRHPVKGVMAVLGLLVMIIMAYGALGKGVEFFPDIEPDNLVVQLHARGNLSIDEKDQLVQEVERRILTIDGIRVVYASTGAFRQRDTAEDVVGMIQLELMNWKHRPRAAHIIETIEEATADMAGVVVEVSRQKAGPTQGKPIELEFSSRDPKKLEPAVAKVVEKLQQVEGVRDIEDTRPIPAIEWRMKINRELASLFGADVQLAGAFMKLVSNGLIIDTYRPDDADDEIDVVVRFPKEDRTLSMLDRLRITTPEGKVPLSYFVSRTPGQTISTIRRVDQQRVMTVKADVDEGVLANNIVKEMTAWFKTGPLDPDVRVRFKGEDEDKKETQDFLGKAFLLALFMMFLILVTQFNNIYQTLVVMSAVFFSTAGVFVGLLVTAQPFGIVMCGIGVISLAGIVVNNNIIFIEAFKRFTDEGYGVGEALIHTGVQRLRPILLTAGTTVLGLLPMVTAVTVDFTGRQILFGSPSSQWWTQLSTAIAGGLSFATILTLFFTPCLLMVGHRVGQWREARKAGRAGAISHAA